MPHFRPDPSKNIPIKARVHQPYAFSDQIGAETIPFGTAHIFIAHNKGVTTPPGAASQLITAGCPRTLYMYATSHDLCPIRIS